MAKEQSLCDLLEERQARSETIYQAVRYYLAERLHDPDPGDLLVQLAAVMDGTDNACATLSRDALLLENAALLVLSQAWEDPEERERVRRAIDGATGMLPVIDPNLIAIVCLYGVYLVLRGGRHEKTTIRRPDGSLEEHLVVESGPLAPVLRMLGNRAAAPVPVPLTRPIAALRPVVLVDIQGSAHVNGYQQAQRRAWLLSSMREAVGSLRLRWEDLDPVDRGDGVRLLVPEDGATLVDLAAHLEGPLREHARMSGGLTRLKVRMTIHAGLLHWSANGWDGDPLVHTARLDAAQAAKELLEQADAGLALILSEWVFEEVVCSGYGRVKKHDYQQITVAVQETTTTAWVHLS